MTQTTDPDTDPRVRMPLPAIDELQTKVLMSAISTGRPDLRALRSLPTWRGVTLARVLFKMSAITRAELDAIVREAEVMKDGVKADKRPAPVVTDAAVETVCVAVHPGWEAADDLWRTEQREAVRRALVAAARRMDWSAVIPTEDELAVAIADPSTLVKRGGNESVTRWSARAVGQVLRHKLFG